MPVVRMATFSTWANAWTAGASSRIVRKSRWRTFMARPSPISNRQHDPPANHQDVQHDADGEHGLHAPGACRGRTALDDPDLIDERADRDGEKEGLQTLEDKQTASAQ